MPRLFPVLRNLSRPGSVTRSRLCLAAVLVTSAVAGCGTGTYNQRMKDRLAELRHESPFLEFLERGEYEVTDAQGNPLGVFIRPPKYILKEATQSYQDNKGFPGFRTGSKDESGAEISLRRVQPPFLKLDNYGFCLSYEWFVTIRPRDWTNPEQPVYVYFAVSDAKAVEQQTLLDGIQQALAATFSGGGGEGPSGPADSEPAGAESGGPAEIPLQWETLSLGAPGGGQIEWKRIRLQAPMYFDCGPANGTMGDLPGIFDLYLHSDDTYHVIIAWRTTVRADEMVNIMQAAEVAVGTLRIDPPPPPEEGTPPAEESAEAETETSGG